MSIMRAFARGFLSDQVQAMDAKEKYIMEQNKMIDEINANKASQIEVMNARIDKENEIINIRTAEDIKKNKSYAKSLGFKNEFIESLSPVLFEDISNFNDYLTHNAQIYGINDWYTRPINHGAYQGYTIQDMKLANINPNNMPGEFNKKTVADNIINSTNVPDNVTKLTVGNYENTSNLDNQNFSGSELFFGKKQIGRGEGKLYAHADYEDLVYGYKRETSPGSGEFSQTIYFDILNDENQYVPAILPVSEGTGWHEQGSQTFNSIMEQNIGFFDNMSKQDFQLEHGGKIYRIGGLTKTYTDGKTETFINSIDPRLAKIIDFDLLTERTVPGLVDTPDKKVTTVNSINIPYDAFEAYISKNLNTTLLPYNAQRFFDKTDAVIAPVFADLSVNQKETVKSNYLLQAGFVENRDFTPTRNAFTNEIESNVFGDTQGSQAAIAASAVFDNAYASVERMQAKIQSTGTLEGNLFDEKIVNELSLPTNNPNELSADDLANSIGNYYKNLKSNLIDIEKQNIARFYVNEAGEMQETVQDLDGLNLYLQNNGLRFEADVSTKIGTMADDIANGQLSNIKTIDSLIKTNQTLRFEVATAEKSAVEASQRGEQAIMDMIFPPSERAVGNTLEGFVDYYVGNSLMSLYKPENIAALQIGLSNITSNDVELDYLKSEVAEYLDKKRKDLEGGASQKEIRDAQAQVPETIPDVAVTGKESVFESKEKTETKEDLTSEKTRLTTEINNIKEQIQSNKAKSKNEESLKIINQPLENKLQTLEGQLDDINFQLGE